MQPIVLTATVDETRRLVIDLPDDVPTGQIEVTISPLAAPESAQNGEQPKRALTCEEARARLRAAGVLLEIKAPPDAKELSEEEERLAKFSESRFWRGRQECRPYSAMITRRDAIFRVRDDRESQIRDSLNLFSDPNRSIAELIDEDREERF